MKISLLFLILLFCCAFDSLAQKQIGPEEYEVYKALLNDGSQQVISKDTISVKLKSSYWKRQLFVVESETRNNFNDRNEDSFELKDNFALNSQVKLVTYDDVGQYYELAKENELTAENAFRKKFGSSTLVFLSRVGFNKSKNQALVNLVSNTGLCGTCSESYFFVLSKENDVWIIKKKLMYWIS